MRLSTDCRAEQRERELTAYLVVGDADAARRLARRTRSVDELIEVAGRQRPACHAPSAALSPRLAAFWWWWASLPVADRVALVTFARHGWPYDAIDPLLADGARILGVHDGQRRAAEAMAHALEGLASTLPERRVEPRHSSRVAVLAGLVAAGLLAAGTAGVVMPDPAPAAPTSPVVALPRPAARPLPNYEFLAVVPGAQWDLPARGSRRSAPPWSR